MKELRRAEWGRLPLRPSARNRLPIARSVREAQGRMGAGALGRSRVQSSRHRTGKAGWFAALAEQLATGWMRS